MTFAGLVLVVLKVLVAVTYLFLGAALAVWADRRQGALLQDRVGPTRAVWFVSRRTAQTLVFLGAVATAGLVMVAVPWAGPRGTHGGTSVRYLLGRTTLGCELAILTTWLGLLLLGARARRAGPTSALEEALARLEPRSLLLGGVVAHVAAFPLLRLVPTAQLALAAPIAETAAGLLLLGAGVVAAVAIPEGRFGIRLAGLLHPVADAIKMLFKEDLRPKRADRLLFALAPMIAFVPVLVTFAVIPFGSTLCLRDTNHDGALGFAELLRPAAALARSGKCEAGQLAVPLQIADLDVGLLYVFALAGMGIVGAAVAGWASDNKFSLLGALRAISQMISYEVAMGLSAVGLLLVVGSVHMQRIVDWQGEHAWGIFVQPLGFVLFFTALVAETKRVPFDQPEGESEIVAGYFLEYSAMKFGLFYLGEFAEFAFSSALLVTLFFGGYHLPFLHADGIDVAFGGTSLLAIPLSHPWVVLIHVLTFFGKTVLLGWLMVFIRWTLPRFRYDQVMALGWKKLLPWSLVNLLLTGLVVLGFASAGPTAERLLGWLADASQALVALGTLLAIVAAVSWLIEPVPRTRFLRSSAARLAAASGGTKMQRMGA